jgi:hypothetical protein
MQIVSGFERRRKFFATLHEDTKDQREQGAPSASVHVVWSCHQAFRSMKIESGLPAKIDSHETRFEESPTNANSIWVASEDLLGKELSLSSRGRMALGVGEIFWFISHTLPQCHTLQGVGDTYL